MRYIALTEKIETAGSIVWWRLSGSVSYDGLCAALRTAGLEELFPHAVTPDKAMRRALASLAGARSLARRTAVGWALVRESVRGDELFYDVHTKCRLAKDGTAHFHGEMENVLRRAYYDAFERLTPDDVSEWLVRMVFRCQAVALRDGGGIYFVPAGRVADWEKVTGVLTSVADADFDVAHKIFAVPALKSDEAVAAVLDAVLREADAAIDDIEEDIADGMSERRRKSRERACVDLEKKVAMYEQTLGTRAEGFAERLAALRASLSAAAMLADVAEEVA